MAIIAIAALIGISILASIISEGRQEARKNQAHRDAYNARAKQIDDEYRAWSGKSRRL